MSTFATPSTIFGTYSQAWHTRNRQALPQINKTQLRSFLGLCNVYRRFIEDLTGMEHAVNKLLKSHTWWLKARRKAKWCLKSPDQQGVFTPRPWSTDVRPSVFYWLGHMMYIILNKWGWGMESDRFLVKIFFVGRTKLCRIRTRMSHSCVGT